MKIRVPDTDRHTLELLLSVWPKRFKPIAYDPTTCTTEVKVLGPAQTLVALKYPNWIGKTL